MKKWVKKLIMLVLASLLLFQTALAIDLYVDGWKLEPEVEPVIIGDRTMVPVRAIFEALGADVQWNDVTRTVTATKGETTISIAIDSTTAYVNGAAVPLDVPAQIVSDRTMVPARFVSESLGADVWWDADTRTVYITTVENYDGYRAVPHIIYTTTEYENGFADVFMFADGEVGHSFYLSEVRTHHLITSVGTIALLDGFGEVESYTSGRFCFQYIGFSDILGVPMGVFMEMGYNEGSYEPSPDDLEPAFG